MFLVFLHILFDHRDTSDFISTELRIFKQDDYFASKSDEHRDFYKQVIKKCLDLLDLKA